VTNDGAVLDGDGVAVSNTTADEDYYPDIAWNGSNYLVTWQRTFIDDIRAQRLNTAGALVGSAFSVAPPSGVGQYGAQVASNGSQWFVVWFQGPGGGPNDVYGARVTAAGSSLGAIPISTGSSDQTQPDVAFNGTWLVAWRDTRNGPNNIYATRVGTDGTVQDGNGFLIDTGSPYQGVEWGPTVSPAPGSNRWAVVRDSEAYAGIIQHIASSK
jgi:hypothetical protein